jgi:hypothetical protein
MYSFSAVGKRASQETKPETPVPDLPTVEGDPLAGDSKYGCSLYHSIVCLNVCTQYIRETWQCELYYQRHGTNDTKRAKVVDQKLVT